MKNLIFISFLSLLFFASCQTNNKPQNNDGYVYEVDTSYVSNSLEIEDVDITFFKIKEDGKTFILKSSTFENTYSMFWFDKTEYDGIHLSEEYLDKFIQDIAVVFDNPDKRLEFFATDENFIKGKVSNFLESDVDICSTRITPIQLNGAVCESHFHLSIENYDKMVSALRKFKGIQENNN